MYQGLTPRRARSDVNVGVDFTGETEPARAAVLGSTAILGLLTAPNVQGISLLQCPNLSVPVRLVSTGGERKETVCRVQTTTTQTVLIAHNAHHVPHIPRLPQGLARVVVKQGMF